MSVSVLHFAQEGDTSGFFPQLARWHDRGRYKMLFATLNPMEPRLRELMAGQGVTCFSCESRSRASYALGLARLAAFLRRERVAILHTHLFEPSVVGLLAGLLARTPLRVMTRHYSDYHTRIDKRWHVRLDRMCTRLASGVIAVSRHTAAHLLDAEAAPRERVHVVTNGIDFERVKPSGPDAALRVRKELGLHGVPILLVPARLHAEKGHRYLFEALPRLRARLDGPFAVLVAGEGTCESAYRREVETLGCQDLVRFLGFRRDLPDLMAAADVVVLPSVAEAFGLVLAEALYLGVPVVATRVGGIPEIVDDGIDGVLVPAADSAALADALAALVGDPARRSALAGRGRAKVVERFSFERMVRSYEALYERLLARG